tara:strand:+ start:976 stop:1695 length:720 start_codon:yes stop_codon:yes gene_type:complete
MKDTLFAQEQQVPDFSFNAEVVKVFPDMVKRSVPGYASIVSTMGKLAAKHCPPNGKILDLGTSRGAVAISTAQHLNAIGKSATIHAVDSSLEMYKQLEIDVEGYPEIKPFYMDAQSFLSDCNSDVITMNLVLQFIDPACRLDVLHAIYSALPSGGMFLITEKFHESDSEIDQNLIEMHHDFKAEQGYSAIEIAQKSESIKNVMLLDSIEHRKAQLRNLGFKRSFVWYQCFNFYSMVAFK